MKYFKPLIGLEMHVELSTKSKMFCQCDAAWQTYKPNENTCPVCLGLPGALPVPNKKAVEYTIKIAQALGCKINKVSHFDRKHYFYPDLPKGYQISQYDEPIGVDGRVSVFVKNDKNEYIEKSFRIHRVHLEEDTGKLIHKGDESLMDFNRSGVPLVEIVTEADFDSSDDVKAYLQEIHTIVRYLDVSSADMEKGSMRLEPNISVREYEGDSEPTDWQALPFPKYKVEVKNINSFNYVKKAIDFEVTRQTEILEKGELPDQETRGWNEDKGITFSQRSKEDAHDYRYFPEPDIPPMTFTDSELDKIKHSIPELPAQKRIRFQNDYKLKIYDVSYLVQDITASQIYENAMTYIQSDPELSKIPNISQGTANVQINKIRQNELSIEKVIDVTRQTYVKKETNVSRLAEVVAKVISSNEKSVTDYKSGKTNAIMFLLGQVMKEMKGAADAQTVRGELEKKLSN